MTPRELRIISSLAIFLCAAMPAMAGAIAYRAQPILVSLIATEAQVLPSITSVFFNHFGAALSGLLIAGLATTIYAARHHFRSDDNPVMRMSHLLVATCFAALVSVLFLGFFLLATVLPVYAKLTER